MLFAETAKHLEERHAFSFDASKADSGKQEIYIVVIGESSRPDHWSINGYERETSPRIARIDGMLAFRDVITTSPTTKFAVPSMLSLASVEDWSNVERQRSIVSAFRETGFDTYWLSVQEVSFWGGIIVNLANEAEVVRYYQREFDAALVDDVRRILDAASNRDRKLIVLHTKGSHFDYSDRYPEEFGRYEENAPTRRKSLVNTYDNSILYTDYLLAELIDRIDETGAHSLLLYASDHGQNLMDDENQFVGHSIGNEYDLRTATFLWASKGFRERFPDKFDRASINSEKKLSLANLPHSLLDIAGIGARGLDLSKSVFSEKFTEQWRLFRSRAALFVYADGEIRSLDGHRRRGTSAGYYVRNDR
jgi:heptose-I-phosphate ethanolaminephosphotransferase